MLFQPLDHHLVAVPQVGLRIDGYSLPQVEMLLQGQQLAAPRPQSLPAAAPLSLLRPTLTAPSVSTNQRRSMDCVCSWLSSGLARRISCFTWASSRSRRSLQYKKVRAVFHSRTSCGRGHLSTHGGVGRVGEGRQGRQETAKAVPQDGYLAPAHLIL